MVPEKHAQYFDLSAEKQLKVDSGSVLQALVHETVISFRQNTDEPDPAVRAQESTRRVDLPC